MKPLAAGNVNKSPLDVIRLLNPFCSIGAQNEVTGALLIGAQNEVTATLGDLVWWSTVTRAISAVESGARQGDPRQSDKDSPIKTRSNRS